MILLHSSRLVLCLVTVFCVRWIPWDTTRGFASPAVAAEVLASTPWTRRFLSRAVKEAKNGAPTNPPSPAPTPAPTKKAKSDTNGAAEGASDFFGAQKQNVPSAAPTIPKDSRQATQPASALPPFFQLQPTAPMSAPTPVAGSTAPATAPVAEPVPTTPAPIAAPVPIAVPTAPPQITNVTDSPTASPVDGSDAPSATPMQLPVSDAPSGVPILTPTIAPSSFPSMVPSDVPTMKPSDTPTSQPSMFLERVDETVRLLLISYPNVPLLNETEIGLLETLTETWFEEFYNEGGFGNRNETSSNQTESTTEPSRRFLRIPRQLEGITILNMTTIISVQSQNLSEDGSINIVAYNQNLMYRITPDANVTASSVAISPFRNVPANTEYRMRLMSQIAAFENVGDIEPPRLMDVPAPIAPPAPAPTAPQPPVASSEKKTLTSGAIAGIAVGGLIVLGLVGYAFIILPNELEAAKPSVPSSEVPAAYSTDVAKDGGATDFAAQGLAAPSTAEGGAAGEIAAAAAVGAAGLTVGTAAFTKHHDEETSTLGGYSDRDDGNSYAGKSVDTSDFDYSQVGQTAAASSQLTAASAASKSAKDGDLDEEQFVIYAPAGKLGLVVDNPDDGPPVVHAIKEDSVLIDQVHVGDRLIGVDEVDVRQLSPVKVSKLISKRSTNPLRKLTLTRGKPYVDDEETADGGDTSSFVESQMETDTQSESMGAAAMRRRRERADSDDETSHVGSMSHLSGEDEQESVMDYPDESSSVVEAMSHASGGVTAASTTGEEKVSAPAGTNVGEETAEVPAKKTLDP